MREIEDLEAYLILEYDVDIIWGKDEVDAFYDDANCIGINTNHDKQIQLFCLLHEAGHLILRRSDDFKINYPYVAKQRKTQQSSVDVIREEIDAWLEGYKLAKFLNINIDEKRWNRYWRHQVYKYIRWANDRDQ